MSACAEKRANSAVGDGCPHSNRGTHLHSLGHEGDVPSLPRARGRAVTPEDETRAEGQHEVTATSGRRKPFSGSAPQSGQTPRSLAAPPPPQAHVMRSTASSKGNPQSGQSSSSGRVGQPPSGHGLHVSSGAVRRACRTAPRSSQKPASSKTTGLQSGHSGLTAALVSFDSSALMLPQHGVERPTRQSIAMRRIIPGLDGTDADRPPFRGRRPHAQNIRSSATIDRGRVDISKPAERAVGARQGTADDEAKRVTTFLTVTLCALAV